MKAQTDKDGRATFTIDRAGAWLVKTVHMVQLAQPAEAERESYWGHARVSYCLLN